LKKAETLSENNPRCQAITYNNLACYYKRQKKTRSALIYLEKALELENDMDDPSYKADTHLNTCAVLSEMGRHDLALNHA
jgi:tetratricopeptide (TPR) repeat protein